MPTTELTKGEVDVVKTLARMKALSAQSAVDRERVYKKLSLGTVHNVKMLRQVKPSLVAISDLEDGTKAKRLYLTREGQEVLATL